MINSIRSIVIQVLPGKVKRESVTYEFVSNIKDVKPTKNKWLYTADSFGKMEEGVVR
ncbi:hypothetical protein [Aestuariibaculum suncheonense]|uniref:Uncharacterized protein n=1 Tax=Aestuariibaculum suncheonense TaxID=1028745 RepID=A0A8J6QB00_9FLAO|nr:hypothetical protein [Aestuariibaculum suncheonense]MBD0834468.1 hypothetical protein [Aestuariibaculum suncheonense]